MIEQDAHYVVISEMDCTPGDRRGEFDKYGQFHPRMVPRGPIVWETYIGRRTTKEHAVEHARLLAAMGYGRCIVARLTITDQQFGDA